MIEKGDFCWEMSCDSCSHQEDMADSDQSFQSAVDNAKSQGWTLHRDNDGEWYHQCPDCNEEES